MEVADAPGTTRMWAPDYMAIGSHRTCTILRKFLCKL